MPRVFLKVASKSRCRVRRGATMRSQPAAAKRCRHGAAYGATYASSSTPLSVRERRMADVNAPAAPTSIKAYLDALKKCLKGQPPALIQDALADAEEYLRGEQSQTPEESEAQILARVVETYGTPQEVAEEYIAMEQTIQ